MTATIRTVFLGTPPAAVPILRRLAQSTRVVSVITQPDRPRGRSGRPVAPAVKIAAAELGLSIRQPDTRQRLHEAVVAAGTIDVAVVAAYGMIVGGPTLELPRRGMVNVHFSLLPRWRGAAPVERAILAGDLLTGVTVIVMDEGLDTGPILAAAPVSVGPSETAGALTDRLAEAGAELLVSVLPGWVAGRLEPVPQPPEGVTYARKVDTSEARLDPARPAEEILRAVRAFHPRPGASLPLEGEIVKVWDARKAGGPDLRPGEVHFDGRRLLVGTGDSPLELIAVQPAGRRRMDGAAWARGRVTRSHSSGQES